MYCKCVCVLETAACTPNRTQMSVYYKKGRVRQEVLDVDVDEDVPEGSVDGMQLCLHVGVLKMEK